MFKPRNYTERRRAMVDLQLRARGIEDPRVLQAMNTVPREVFIEQGHEAAAYKDGPLPIGDGQTISQPYIVALMIELAEIGPRARVLEVGSGSGYAAAVMSRIAGQVYAAERHASLGKAARARWKQLGYENIDLKIGDGTLGWPEKAPFDAIIVSAAAPHVPGNLKAQLSEGGHVVIPVEETDHPGQELMKITRGPNDTYTQSCHGGVRFVPLTGAQGW